MLFFFCAVFCDFPDRWRFIDTFSVSEDRNQNFAHRIRAARKSGLFPGVFRIEEQKVFAGIEGFICKADEVGLDFSGGFIINPVNRLVARIGNFFCVFGNLNLWYKFAVLILDGGKLVDTSKRRTILGGNQVGTHTPGIDGCSLHLQIMEKIFVQIVGSADRRIWKTGVIEHLASPFWRGRQGHRCLDGFHIF